MANGQNNEDIFSQYNDFYNHLIVFCYGINSEENSNLVEEFKQKLLGTDGSKLAMDLAINFFSSVRGAEKYSRRLKKLERITGIHTKRREIKKHVDDIKKTAFYSMFQMLNTYAQVNNFLQIGTSNVSIDQVRQIAGMLNCDNAEGIQNIINPNFFATAMRSFIQSQIHSFNNRIEEANNSTRTSSNGEVNNLNTLAVPSTADNVESVEENNIKIENLDYIFDNSTAHLLEDIISNPNTVKREQYIANYVEVDPMNQDTANDINAADQSSAIDMITNNIKIEPEDYNSSDGANCFQTDADRKDEQYKAYIEAKLTSTPEEIQHESVDLPDIKMEPNDDEEYYSTAIDNAVAQVHGRHEPPDVFADETMFLTNTEPGPSNIQQFTSFSNILKRYYSNP